MGYLSYYEKDIWMSHILCDLIFMYIYTISLFTNQMHWSFIKWRLLYWKHKTNRCWPDHTYKKKIVLDARGGVLLKSRHWFSTSWLALSPEAILQFKWNSFHWWILCSGNSTEWWLFDVIGEFLCWFDFNTFNCSIISPCYEMCHQTSVDLQ